MVRRVIGTGIGRRRPRSRCAGFDRLFSGSLAAIHSVGISAVVREMNPLYGGSGVFAAGDVRAGNVKRVASAVGEGSISISLVHRVLAEL
jgi:hypothetical protein